MQHVIFVPGPGADERLFDLLTVPNCANHYIKWVKPLQKERFDQYLHRIKSQCILTEPVILVGVSLGGIVAMELREMVPVKKLLLFQVLKPARIFLHILNGSGKSVLMKKFLPPS